MCVLKLHSHYCERYDFKALLRLVRSYIWNNVNNKQYGDRTLVKHLFVLVL